MKRAIKLMPIILLFFAVTSELDVKGAIQTKKYHESWPVASVQALEVNNRFGEVRITWDGGQEVTVDVVITVQASTEKAANALLEQLNVRIGKTGDKISAETVVSSSFKGRQQFSIDYSINIPPDKRLNITNKYGNTFVDELRAGAIFDAQYGNFNANTLQAPGGESVQINLAYGKGGVENAGDLNVVMQYSTFTFGQVRDLKISSKYAVINLDKARAIAAESKYDTYSFGMVGDLQVNSKYTRIQMEELLERLNIDAGYGGVKIDRVNPRFSSIIVNSSYGQVTVGMGEASYHLDASCDYCGITYPESRFKGTRMSETRTRIMKGVVGTGSEGKVYIRSRYGNIKLD